MIDDKNYKPGKIHVIFCHKTLTWGQSNILRIELICQPTKSNKLIYIILMCPAQRENQEV